MQDNFNNIKNWLQPKLDARGLSVERFANQVGLSKAQIHFYYQDVNRPTEQAMARICNALGLPLEEGLRQYTPKKAGRPKHGEGPTERRVYQKPGPKVVKYDPKG